MTSQQNRIKTGCYLCWPTKYNIYSQLKSAVNKENLCYLGLPTEQNKACYL